MHTAIGQLGASITNGNETNIFSCFIPTMRGDSGDQSNLTIYMNKSIVTHSNNTQVKSESKYKYFYLSKSKKVVKNYTFYVVKVESGLILQQVCPVSF